MIALITILSMLISMLLGFIFGMIFTYIVGREVYRGKTVKFLVDKTPILFAFPGIGLVALLVLLLFFIVCYFLKWTKLNLVITKAGKYINKKSNKILNMKINI